MTILLLHFLKKRSHGCRISDVGGHDECLDLWMRFGDAVGDCFELVSAASDKDDCFCASGGKGWNKSLMYVS